MSKLDDRINAFEGTPTFLQRIRLGLPVDSKGNNPNVARSSEDWYEWKIEMKKKHPIKYFLNQDFSSVFIWPWSHRLTRVSDWVRYRTTRRYHFIPTGQEPGYMDAGDRIFYASFNLLKNFVEIEKAHMNAWCGEKELKGRKAGVAYLTWETELGEDGGFGQAEKAKEVLELYTWWVDVRPNREDAYDDTRWNTYHKLRKDIYGDDGMLADHKDTPELTKLRKELFDKSNKIETNSIKEDDEMFMRLVKIRKGLWT